MSGLHHHCYAAALTLLLIGLIRALEGMKTKKEAFLVQRKHISEDSGL